MGKTPQTATKRGEKVKLVDLQDSIAEGRQMVLSNSLVDASFKATLGQLKVIWMFGSIINSTQDKDFRFYEVDIKQVRSLTGLDHETLESAVAGLISNPIHIPMSDSAFDGKSKRRDWLILPWVASAEYKGNKGVVEFEFSDKMKPFLLALTKHFTISDLDTLNKLQSAYSWQMYLLLKKEWGLMKKRRKKSFYITLPKLRLILGVDSPHSKTQPYERFYDFRVNVLDLAKAELELKADLNFEYVTVKEWRTIVGVEITITKPKSKRKKPSQIGGDPSLFPALPEGMPLEIKELVETGFDRDEGAKLWKEGWDYLTPEARKEVEPYITGGGTMSQYIRDKIQLLKTAKKKGTVKSDGGFLNNAIRRNWTSAEQEMKQKTAKRKAHFQKRIQEEEVRRGREDAEARNKEVQDARLDAQYMTLSPVQKERINRLVVERLLTMDDFTAQRVEIERVADEIDSGEGFFQELPAGVGITAQRVRRELMASNE